jgi:L,D-peptidoglycan transpeptidase YkuD (ErfK/YbiS/YcfS/YnhG family)
MRALKREGDGGTPLGRLPVRQVLYRADRIARPRTQLGVRAIRDRDGWCDDPADRNYNRLISLPTRRSAELGYNDRPRVRGKGSAIFVHLARPGFSPTDGCIALSQHDLGMLLTELRRGSSIVVMR